MTFQYKYDHESCFHSAPFIDVLLVESWMVLRRLRTTMVCSLHHRTLSTDRPAGLDLARLADLPDDVLTEARRVSEKLTELEERKKEESKTNKVAIRRKALLRVILPRSALAPLEFWLVSSRARSLAQYSWLPGGSSGRS